MELIIEICLKLYSTINQVTKQLLTVFSHYLKNNRNRKFEKNYQLADTIEGGTLSKVSLCTRKCDGKMFVVKTISKGTLSDIVWKRLKNESIILNALHHIHIISIVDTFEKNDEVKMVLELCKGGNLLNKLSATKHKCFNEIKTCQIISKLAKVLQYIHSKNIVHRDLKPENILFTEDRTLKVADFGLSYYKDIDDNYNEINGETDILMKSQCGTPYYVAPEIIETNNAKYSKAVDLWSLGVVLFVMLSGNQPFFDQSQTEIFNKIRHSNYEFKSPIWDNISDEAKDLISQLLCVDVHKRYTAEQVLHHPWLQNNSFVFDYLE